MDPVSVTSARLEHADGTPWSAQFGDVYHASAGGIAQARHVFLAGNALPDRWRGRGAFTILETGFGLGLNFLCTWDAWRRDSLRPARLHYVSVEKHPFTREDLARALAAFPEVSELARELVDAWPAPIAGFHRLHFERDGVTLTLALGDARQSLAQVEAAADALFLDGFAPARNPDMWSPEVVRELARLAAPGATLATWTVSGGVRAALAGAGFRVEKRAGFAAKREMLHGVREGTGSEATPDRRAMVVGAGLAGTVAAERLAARGWNVTLVDASRERSLPAAGLVRPIVNLRDAANAQLSRPAFLYALRHFRAAGAGVLNPCGVLQLAADAEEEARFETIARSQGWPHEVLRFVDGDGGSAIAGRPVARGGWWFAGGGVVDPAALIHASRARAGERLRSVEGRRVQRLEREAREWRALDDEGRVIAATPVAILANAADAARLLPEARLRLSAVRGQVTYLAEDAARKVNVVVSGNGYVAPRPGGGHVIGATYRHDDFDESLRVPEHGENLSRAESMLPGFTAGVDPQALRGWVGYRATVPDRLPIHGATAVEGIFTATGLGSRGLLWAPLGAELLASLLEREPLPVARDFAAAVSPLRFLS